MTTFLTKTSFTNNAAAYATKRLWTRNTGGSAVRICNPPAVARERVGGIATARPAAVTIFRPEWSVLSPVSFVRARDSSPEAAARDIFGGRRMFSSTTTRRSSSNNDDGSSVVSDRGGAIIQGISLSEPEATITIHLPPADDPVGLQLYKKAIYCPVSRILRTSAHVGTDDSNQKADGIVGDTVSPEDAKAHARNSGLRLLATIHDFLDGDLDRVEQVLHLNGMVKSTGAFAGHAGVVDGCSEVLAEALGRSSGIGTRACFGVGSLGATVACTIEVRVRPLRSE